MTSRTRSNPVPGVDPHIQTCGDRTMTGWFRNTTKGKTLDRKKKQSRFVFLSSLQDGSSHEEHKITYKQGNRVSLGVIEKHGYTKMLPVLSDRCYDNTYQPKVALGLTLPTLYLKDSKSYINYDGKVDCSNTQHDKHQHGSVTIKASSQTPLQSRARSFYPSVQTCQKSNSLCSPIKLSAECLRKNKRTTCKRSSKQGANYWSSAAVIPTISPYNSVLKTTQRSRAMYPGHRTVTPDANIVIQQDKHGGHRSQLPVDQLAVYSVGSRHGDVTSVHNAPGKARATPVHFQGQVSDNQTVHAKNNHGSMTCVGFSKAVPRVHGVDQLRYQTSRVYSDDSLPSLSPVLPVPGSWARANTQVHVSMEHMAGAADA